MSNETNCVYRLAMKEGGSKSFDTLYPADNKTFPWKDLHSSAPLLSRWSRPQLELCRQDLPAEVHELNFTGQSAVVLFERAAAVLKPLLASQAELLPVCVLIEDQPRAKSAAAYLLHSLVNLPLADGSKFWKQGKTVIGATHLSLCRTDYDEHTMFRLLPPDPGKDIYVTASIAKQLRGAKLSGLELQRTPVSFNDKRLVEPPRRRPDFISKLPFSFSPSTPNPKMTPAIWKQVTRQLEVCLKNVRLFKGRVRMPQIGEPLSKSGLQKLEQISNYGFPEDLRDVLLNRAAYLDFSWLVESHSEDLGEYSHFTVGEGWWDFRRLQQRMRGFRALIDAGRCEYEKRIPLWEFGNGDYVALDLQNGSKRCAVVYLDHERRDAIKIANNFVDYVLRMAHLCGVSAEYLIGSPLHDSKKGVLSTTHPMASGLRAAMVGEMWTAN